MSELLYFRMTFCPISSSTSGTTGWRWTKRNYRQLVDTTVEIANRVGASEIINRLVDDLKDENENYRKMVMESIEKIMGGLGSADVDSRLDKFDLNLDKPRRHLVLVV